MRYFPLVAAVMALCMLLPAGANGQAGSRPDPNSPAGVEYQLPLDQARKNAAGPGADDKPRRAGSARSPSGAPLFGAGIAARSAGNGPDKGDASNSGGEQENPGDGSGGDDRGEGSGGASSGGASSGDSSAGGSDPEVRRSGVASSDSDDGSVTLLIAGIALGVLLLGGLLGLGLRRGLGQPGT